MRLDGSQPVRYGIKLELDDKYRHLKEVIAELSGIPLANLRLAEVYGAMVKVQRILRSGYVVRYETMSMSHTEPAS